MSNCRCVLFDLDGTLVDTTTLIFASYRHTLASVFGYEASHAQLLAQYGKPLLETMRSFVDEIRRERGKLGAAAWEEASDSELLEHLVQQYRRFNLARHDELIRSFPGVNETLAALAGRGYRLGVVTSKGRHTTELSLARYQLRHFMSVVVALEDTPHHKPHPEPVLIAARQLGLAVGECLLVGDSVFDLRAGRAAGARTGAALWGPFDERDLAAEQPDLLLPEIAALLAHCPALAPNDAVKNL